MKDNIALNKAYSLSRKIFELSRRLEKQRDYVVSNQLLKSATSIGANIEEAQAACSRNDFVAKLSIASKEARETRYWLRLIRDARIIELDEGILSLANELVNILTSSVKTIQENP